MIKDVLQIGEPILEKPTKEVTDISSSEVKTIINDLVDTCIAMSERSAGLSSNQIGYDLRICVCRRTDLEDQSNRESSSAVDDKTLWEVMINPEITKASKDESAYWEGCLSIGETEKDTIWGPVWRPDTITLIYTNREGEKKELEATDFFSHVVQHELDHLDGVLFISKVPNPEKNLWKSPRLNEFLEKNKEFPPVA
ncbi:peptide deformylase [Candidatus Dojkabacteria bacterium]|uniref:Peptide deformylase n=1 Tax=Candidatus Dojkabacteria bacterium TaxID=2099670 RepID=A0A955L875_9BACT|nr:peptide deformylase [Candidatus Dojkabacteria bacterium]